LLVNKQIKVKFKDKIAMLNEILEFLAVVQPERGVVYKNNFLVIIEGK